MGLRVDLLAGSRVSGFLQFLHLLSTHPWQEQALVVDPNAELSAANREAAVAAHSKVIETPPEVTCLCAYATTSSELAIARQRVSHTETYVHADIENYTVVSMSHFAELYEI